MDFTPIRISTIVPHKEINFDLYIFFKEKFLKYIEVGRSLEETHLEKLKKQKIARFYIMGEHEMNYQNFLDEVLRSSFDDPSVSVESRVNLAEGAASSAIEAVQDDPNSKASYDVAERAANSLKKLIFGSPEALKSFFGKKAEESERLIKHSVNVSALVVSLAQMYEMTDEEQTDLAIAGLTHDIGISRLPENDQDLFLKDPKTFTLDEKRAYEKHPELAMEIFRDNDFINPNIKDLILNHEEKLSGMGYPGGKNKLTLQQEILCLSNCYDKKMLLFDITPKEAQKSLQIDELGNYSLELINKFKEHLKKEGMI